MDHRYDPHAIEARWQRLWRERDAYRTADTSDRPKFYCLDFFPYPSGDGLSVGHCRNYVPTDVVSRFKRMSGFNVLHPMGWDAFGLPAENYAIKMGVNPRVTTERNIANYHRQMDLIGLSYDWSREITSCNPDYYRWTQWFFLLMYERGLAYRGTGQQWWCPVDKTILANEQVEQGRCWRCGSEVTKVDLEQWYFRITDYAQRLLDDLATIDWPEKIKLMQANWIGRSEGAEVEFALPGRGDTLTVFTTRPDTLFGATYMVLAPEHPLVDELTTAERRAAVVAYQDSAPRERDRAPLDREGEDRRVHRRLRRESRQRRADPHLDQRLRAHGLRHGRHHGRAGPRRARLRLRHQVRAADRRGDRAAGGRPGHAQRGLHRRRGHGQLRRVRRPGGAGRGLRGHRRPPRRARPGPSKVNFKLRDWLISRQRYWGVPIPIVYCDDCGVVPVPAEQLPVLLPEIEDYKPTDDAQSPLARDPAFVRTTCPRCGGPARRETDTMDTFVCSSWYHFRYPSPHDDTAAFDRAAVAYWLPVDMYVGGAEHAVMHLLYARFFCKVLHDAGYVGFGEPYAACATRA